jgi:uncharacterized protein
MSEYHEPYEQLSEEARNFHRALKSLQEELEAVDWYHQRWEVCKDESLRAVIAHNRDEEIEHAVMTLEWLRRNMPGFDHNLKTYLFTEAPITEVEEREELGSRGLDPSRAPRRRPGGGSGLSIGSLKGEN